MKNSIKKEGPEYIYEVIKEAKNLWPTKLHSKESTVLLIATSGQESNWKHQKQIGGPARGLWQFEKAGGVYGVMTHPSTKAIAKDICRQLSVPFDQDEIYKALSDDKVSDILDASFARLLYWSSPKPLPAVGDVDGAWKYYLDCWRPGHPRLEHWSRCYSKALEFVK